MDGRSGKRIFSGAAATIVAAVLLSGPAFGGMMSPSNNYEVAVKLKKGPPAFHGKVVSQNDFCVAEREVKLKKDLRGRKNPTVGLAVTDLDGDWEFRVEPLKSGAYYAKAPLYGSASLGIQCGRAVSRVLVVD